MKRVYPALYRAISVWITTPLIGCYAIGYASRAVSGPAGEAYRIGLAVFGVTAALCGVCFAMAAAPGVKAEPLTYAGEKFLHSTILVVQTLVVIFIRESMTSLAAAHPIWGSIARWVAVFLLTTIVTAAFWTWYHGFSTLNTVLWGNWQKRIEELNRGH